MEYRTDLAVESPIFSGQKLPAGINRKEVTPYGIPVSVVQVKTQSASKRIGKPKGTYITVSLGRVLRREKKSFENAVLTIGSLLKDMMNMSPSLPVLVVGLGNRSVTPDAVGPIAADHILVTRHLRREMPEQFGLFRPVSAIAPGVLGTTGMESAEIIRALAGRVDAAAVILIDALAAIDTEKLCGTVQLSNTGVTPGSGIGNHRIAIDRAYVGCPVFTIGVPTVTDANTLAENYLERAGYVEPAKKPTGGGMIVTSSDIDQRVREIARVLSYAINWALQENLTMDDLTDLTF